MVEENTSSSEDIPLAVEINDNSTEVVAPPVETPREKPKQWITLDQVRQAEPREVNVYNVDDAGNVTDEFIGKILARPTTIKMRRIVKKKLKEQYAHLEDEEEIKLMEAALLAQQIIIKPQLTDDAIEDGDLRFISLMAKAATNAFGKRSVIELKK